MNITKEEVQQILYALENERVMGADERGDYTIEITPKIITKAITLLQSKLVEPVHTDHPIRHHDRTCPACREDAEQAAIKTTPMQKRADYLPPQANSL